MPSIHDVIVIGASAGGVEGLQQIVSQLPADFPGSILVVVHLLPRGKSFLPSILSRVANIPATHPEDGDPIEPGRIYIAPPDHHLVVERGHVHLSCGPKEQHHRPCINVLFRTAAAAYGNRVVGVLLSGELDDGTAGMWEIERRGGTTIVQNPEEAAFPSMPLSALREIEVDYTLPLAEIGPLLYRLATESVISKSRAVYAGETGTNVAPAQKAYAGEPEMEAVLTDLTCPDCRGTIWEVKRGNAKDYQCRVGHTFSARTMLAEHFATQEKVLYSAIVALEEGASLATRVADQFPPEFRERLLQESSQRKQEAKRLRQLIEERVTFEFD